MWRKFPDEKPLPNQICLVAAGPGRVVQHVALRWDAYAQEFLWVEPAEDSFDPFPTEEATHWMPLPNAPDEIRDTAKYPQHNTDSEHCWCSPDTIVMENGAKVIVHKQEQ